MSMILCEDNVYFIDHRDFISTIYKNVSFDSDKTRNLSLTNKLFCIKSDSSKEVVSKKRPRISTEIIDDANKVKQMYNKLISKLQPDMIKETHDKYNVSDTSSVRNLSQAYFESTIFDHAGVSGGNNSDKPLKCKIKDQYFLIPEQSRFLCGDVSDQCRKLIGNKYDIIVADPPWWNKYIRRLKGANEKLGYSMMYNEDIADIPVKELMSENCLVAVWCTNAPSNITAVKDKIFPQWGVEYVATWYWLKLTINIKPLCVFGSGCKKQPYERIILGKVGNIELPDDVLVASIPSALHSHKPPLQELLTNFIKTDEPQFLELFARYLLPRTTSIGLEPLKWQHISLYEET
ncbi:N(6)-adenine-specific methyltransferase METTL4 [Danaus plexippus]|uniref:N(6)-adenine-specific methyltransferase METTL4 n=1 Tax=Danaus plexippus TaxID=13037 RepID=UPI002AB2E2EA|nr:N(6)-adenine-specific methyltransferase METTL4 [Danaus plexippus]